MNPLSSVRSGLRLRPTMLSDLEYVSTVENDPANSPYITPWDGTQHEAAIRFPDFRHFIVEAGDTTDPLGFVILVGCRNPNHAIELKRMVVQPKGRGLGRACLRALKRIAFRDLGAHRFWLDVKTHNLRAKALYHAEGFVEEGRLRECVRTQVDDPSGYDSLVLMSMLAGEYQQRCDAGLEEPN